MSNFLLFKEFLKRYCETTVDANECLKTQVEHAKTLDRINPDSYAAHKTKLENFYKRIDNQLTDIEDIIKMANEVKQALVNQKQMLFEMDKTINNKYLSNQSLEAIAKKALIKEGVTADDLAQQEEVKEVFEREIPSKPVDTDADV
jgi:ATP-dependent protease Clp ATPase subunit